MSSQRDSIKTIAALVKTQKTTVAKRAKQYLTAIDQVNPKLNALIETNGEQVRRQAQQIDDSIEAYGESQLLGSFFSAKANLRVRGFSSNQGSLASNTPKSDSSDHLVSLLEAQGAICVGKGNMPEYGKSTGHTDNARFGKTRNPFNLDYSPGGSTGGDAAAIAAGLCDFAIGGDSGGSLRVPANFCGLFALKPTQGVLNNDRSAFVTSSFTQCFGTVGVLSKCLDDLGRVYKVLAPNTGSKNQADSKKFLYFKKLGSIPCQDCISDQIDMCVSKLTDLGYSGSEQCPQLFFECMESFIILAGQASLMQEDLLAQKLNQPRDLENESPILKGLREKIANDLPPLSLEGVLLQLAFLERARHEIRDIFKAYDFIICPVAACTPPKHDSASYMVNQQQLESYQVFQFSRAANFLNLPAIAFPTELGANGFPLGLQIVGPRFGEFELIKTLAQCGYTESIKSPSLT